MTIGWTINPKFAICPQGDMLEVVLTFGDEATMLRSVPHRRIIKFVFNAVIFFVISIAKSTSLEQTLALEGFLVTRPV